MQCVCSQVSQYTTSWTNIQQFKFHLFFSFAKTDISMILSLSCDAEVYHPAADLYSEDVHDIEWCKWDMWHWYRPCVQCAMDAAHWLFANTEAEPVVPLIRCYHIGHHLPLRPQVRSVKKWGGMIVRSLATIVTTCISCINNNASKRTEMFFIQILRHYS